MGHADQADRVRPADRSGDRGTPRVSAGRGWPGTSDGFLHLRRLHLRGAFGAEDHPIIDEWCCGYVKGIALDPVGWQPLIDARPDWFEVIPLYGTKCGWERLKELVDVHEDRVARHQAFVDRIAPAAGDIHAYWLTHRAPRDSSTRGLIPAETTHAHVAPARSSSAATGRPISCCINPWQQILTLLAVLNSAPRQICPDTRFCVFSIF